MAMENARPNFSIIDEFRRLQVLADLQLLDTDPEPVFDNLTNLARRITGAPIALLSLVDSERQWFKARCGLDVAETSRDVAFCSHAIQNPHMMIVEDARRDPRFSDNPLVIGDPNIVFYAGVPLVVRGNDENEFAPIGTICVIDHVVRSLTVDQREALIELANIAMSLIEGRRLASQAVKQTERHRQLTHRLVYEQRKFEQAERMAGIGSWRLNLADESISWSPQVYAIHGLPVSEAPPLGAAYDFYPVHAREVVQKSVEHTIRTGQPFDFETDFLTAQAKLRRVRSMGELEVSDGKLVAVFGVVQDVTDRYQAEQILRRSAYSDTLTKLPNRAALNEELETRIAIAQSGGVGLAVLLIDLDGFKAVNDGQGHLAGDELLQAIARRFASPNYKDCFVARLGGDEFIVIPNLASDVPALETYARQIMYDLSIPITTGECEAKISGTIGIAILQAGDSRSDMLRRADQALYAAKNSQRGTARIYGSRRVIHPYDFTIRKTG
ncbi:GGDEF domain-containing protein [Sphingobium sp. SCG-1]|uniref:sensor domain-containing diguanylate cyclase n=1 Tax=Sphingobium sp. SCG-1 TaxID=2072936 RepID=UPI000CD6A6B4|nr:diguanylate cyclase [Sphingobium sp. SCG-1]AUW58390.1 GGDEF domain-containing protein [Sphingobium sp. SCG-1]